MEDKIKKALEKIRPQLQMDGGDVKFVSFDEKTGELRVEMQGACAGCPMSNLTLNEGIAKTVRGEIKEVKKVTAI